MKRKVIVIVIVALLLLGMVGAVFMFRANFPEVFLPAAERYESEAFMRSAAETHLAVGSVSAMVNDRLTTRAQKCSGISTVWYADHTEAAQVEVHITLTVESGRAKVVYVAQTGELTVLAEASGETVTYSGALPVSSGKDRIRLVTDGAAYTLEIEADVGRLVAP